VPLVLYGIAMDDLSLWRQTLARVRRELSQLPGTEKRWLQENLAHIQALQRQIHSYFQAADGDRLCAACSGACCEKGRHHLTLVNLLGFLLADEAPPQPDFTSTCPFLGPTGCRLDIGRRPFNCITFNCELVENALSKKQQDEFYRLEQRLRTCYELFDQRYAGSSLRGLLIRAERLGGGSFLARR